MIRKRIGTFLTVFSVCCLLIATSMSYAAPPKVVLGYIEETTSSSIKVRGKYYTFSGVPLYHRNGARVSSALLQKGNAVEILIEGGKITRIIINNQNLRQ